MGSYMTYIRRKDIFIPSLLLWLLMATTVSCSDTPLPAASKPGGGAHTVQAVADADHFRNILRDNGDRLLVFDFYADWCRPCKLLSPMLETLAGKYSDKAAFFKVDVDRNRDLASAVGLRGVPYVLFVKNAKTVHSLTGLHPKDAYVRVITRYSQVETAEKQTDSPDGEIVNGVRVVRRSTDAQLGTIYVYRGETVNLVVEDIRSPYSIHIPEYAISSEALAGQDLQVKFKAKKIGVFPVFCNGDCPDGSGSQFGQIVVMQLAASGPARYRELSAEQAKALIGSSDPLILDVRTPGEFYNGHLKGAKLIPVQQLDARLSEIQEYKEKDVFLYCRSGNRSTVAAEILMRGGFTKLFNLRRGIIEWEQKGYEVIK